MQWSPCELGGISGPKLFFVFSGYKSNNGSQTTGGHALEKGDMNFHLISTRKFGRNLENPSELDGFYRDGLSLFKSIPKCYQMIPNVPSNSLIWYGITLGRKTTKDMGCYKVEPLSQHDSMQPYKLEMVSYNTSCPHYKMRFHQVAFWWEKTRKPKQHLWNTFLSSSTSSTMVYKNIFLNISLFLATVNFIENLKSRDFWVSRTTFEAIGGGM